jgi:hypothetical protein
MNIDKIKEHPLFLQLTERQQKFVESYILTQDKVASVKAAGYVCKSDSTAEMLARKNLKHPLIKQLVALGLGYEPQGGMLSKNDALMLLSKYIMRTKNPNEFAKLMAMFINLKGWNSNETPDISKAVLAVERQRRKEQSC